MEKLIRYNLLIFIAGLLIGGVVMRVDIFSFSSSVDQKDWDELQELKSELQLRYNKEFLQQSIYIDADSKCSESEP
ncbi:MAG: hypothetical protein HRU38_23305 [Saccharospirillaceae bacterium]|nr:hypothetical protein [Saccharospirillaceae bacterium]